MAKRGMSQSILKIDTNAIYNNWQSLDKKSAKNVETAAVKMQYTIIGRV